MRYLSARQRNAGCCRAVLLRGFLILLQQEKLKHFLKATPVPPCRILFVCFGPESGAGSPWGRKGCRRVPGAAGCTRAASLVGGTRIYLPFHHLIAVPCHVAGASPRAASPV